jgi:hypothetical protein
MSDGYGQPPVQQQGGVPATQQGGQAAYYDDGYDYYGNTFRGMGPSDQAAQVRKAIFDCPLPEADADFGEWIPMLSVAVDMVSRIPGVDHNVINELNLRMELIVDRAHSQGRRRSVAAKMQKLIFRLRSYVSMGDTPMTGMTGVTAMITTNQNQKQEIRMPQQPATTTSSLWPWGRK